MSDDDIEATPPCPFPADSQARLVQPADHPRFGRVGTAVAARWFPPGPRRGDGNWMVRIRFGSKATWEDWRERKKISDEWILFEYQLRREYAS